MTTLTHPPVDQRGHRQLHGSPVEFLIHRLDGAFLAAAGLAGVFPCAYCDAHPGFVLGADGKTLVAKTACPVPDGLDSVVHLDVPSGRIIVNDSLYPVYDVDLPDSPSYNSVAGRVLHNERMARLGCAHGYVGNTSPSLVSTAPGRFVVATFAPDAASGEEGHLAVAGDVLAHICTDLWAYSVADHDDYLVRAAAHDPADLERHRHATVVDVEPGTYRFRNVTGRAGVDVHDGWPQVFAYIDLVGPVGGGR